MSRRTTPEIAEQISHSQIPPLPSSGGSYEIDGGELRQIEAPTAPADPASPTSAAPLTEA